jgi:CRISPR-associated protein Cmr1
MPKADDIPVCPKPPATRSSGRATKEYRISVVTPLFGGGVEAGEPDETLPIRGTSIRGQLQFWWRATRGAGFTAHQELFARHAEVWGTTDRASPVEIDIRDVAVSAPKPCAEYTGKNDGRLQLRWNSLFDSPNRELTYALFPFQGRLSKDRRSVEVRPAKFIETASFTLRLRYPTALGEDVETAVWAWVNFGGLGARTRRGCAALCCEELAPREINDLRGWFGTGVLNGGGNARDWPTMPSSVLIGNRLGDPLDAWRKVIGLLQGFRQDEGIARNPGTQSNRPGRSRYPEPETIRRITGRRSTQHPRLAHIPDDAFPRAEFGLPIVFHFQGQGEPLDTVLYPSCGPNGDSRERMASPLILKPLVVADGKAVPLIMQLVTPGLVGVDLKQGNNSLNLPETTGVRAGRLATYRDSPLAGSASGSAIEAFLSHARRNGFREITR